MTAGAPPLPPIVLFPGSRRPTAPTAPAAPPTATPVPILPPAGPMPLEETCWDQVRLITAGFSTPQEWFGWSGVWRNVRAVVWHDMEGFLEGALQRWNTGVAGAHLCILRPGAVVLTCELRNVAWHAGTNNFPGTDGYGRTPFWRTTNINPYSIGIELEGFVATGYTDEQVRAAVRVARWLSGKYGIAPQHTVDQVDGHHTHAEISSTRSDPGPLFPLDDVLAEVRRAA